MSDETAKIEQDRQLILDAAGRGSGAKLWAYTKLSGPGWLQSAITLGGGSLAGSLYLGVLLGVQAMWWQPLAMIMGVIMLSSIGYVALSSGERPFDAINRHVNPVLGWGWAIATLMANLVWCMPQYSLGTAALTQNLAPESLGEMSNWVTIGLLFAITAFVIWFYDTGSWGVRIFEWLLKGMVAVVVISFFAVVIQMSLNESLVWGDILAGFVPDFNVLREPAPAFSAVLADTGAFRDFWEQQIVANQQQVLITGAATAVGINMTFLLPYSMLRKGWDRDFRGLAIFDLSTGLFVPYLLATSCVVIASATQFHAQEAPGLVPELAAKEIDRADEKLKDRYKKVLDARLSKELGDETFDKLSDEDKQRRREALPLAERRTAAMIVQRDAFDLANSLKRLTGDQSRAQSIFGIGVLGMAISTIIILMLINGFVLTEITGLSKNKNVHLAGCLLASVVGAVGSNTLWKGDARTWLAVPTSMFGMVLLPIAYITFVLLMNSKSLLGENMPSPGKRLRWNVLMILASAFALFCCLWSISLSDHAVYGYVGIGAFFAIVLGSYFLRRRRGEV